MNTMDTKTFAVSEFLSQPLRLHIGGEQVAASSGRTFETLDPGTGKLLATVAAAESVDVNAAVKEARRAFSKSGWAIMSAKDRAVVLHRLADLIDQNAPLLAEIESRDVGKPRAQALAFDIPHAAQTFRYYADLSANTRNREPFAVSGNEAWSVRQPYGVCGFIFPWNFPFLLIGWGVAPALAAGNTVVIKPAEDTPLSALFFARLADRAGVSPQVAGMIVAGGHEVCAHGYRWVHQFSFDEERERAFIHKAVETQTAAIGTRPYGWLSRYLFTKRTRRLLVEEGFLYHMDDYSDDVPRWERVETAGVFRKIVVVPYALDTNDMKFWLAPGYTLAQWLDYAVATFDQLYAEGADRPAIMSLGVHLRIIGRPGRIGAFDRFLQHALSHKDFWTTSRQAIAQRFADLNPD
jgi:peptidoglycan/xylan/chitin deacetylase (PgdA/CDA1 family)